MSRGGWRVLEDAEEVAGDVALEAALDLSVGLALGSAPFRVGAGGGVVAEPAENDDVEGPVELAVPEAIEPVAGGHARRRGDRCDTGEVRERGFVTEPPGMGPRAQERGRD